MITGDYDQLQDLAGNNVCAADNGRLVVAWHKENSCYYLKCGICGECKGITKVPGPRKKDKTDPSLPTAVTLAGVPATDLGSGELLDPQVVKALVVYAEGYGLDPRRGHVVLMYSKPYITIDGYLYHANKSGEPYTLASRPLTGQQRTDYQIPEGAHSWIAEVTMIDTGATFQGIGIVTQEEMTEMSKKNPRQLASPVVAKHPWQLAQKRAEWQALRRAFPIGESPPTEEGTNGESESTKTLES